MPYKVNVGDELPAFIIRDGDGFIVNSKGLRGCPMVFYFYPKDDTPACTKEACDLRDSMYKLDKLEALVIGISPDTAEMHDKFTQKYDLNFTLLPDPDKDLCKKFDVWHNDRIERTTFVVDSEGIIRWIERPVNVVGHSERVVDAVEKLSQ